MRSRKYLIIISHGNETLRMMAYSLPSHVIG